MNSGHLPKQYLKNTLLLKDDIGKAKPSIYKLPNQQFSYGKPLQFNEEDAKQISLGWKFHNPTQDQKLKKDFKQLNKMSLTSGAFKPNHVSYYRKFHDSRIPLAKGTNQIDFCLPDIEFTYGEKNKPSTPVNQVIQNKYGLDAESQLAQTYHTNNTKKFYQKQLDRNRVPKSNKACQLSYTATQTKLAQQKTNFNAPQFKIQRFAKAKPRTNTNNFNCGKSLYHNRPASAQGPLSKQYQKTIIDQQQRIKELEEKQSRMQQQIDNQQEENFQQ